MRKKGIILMVAFIYLVLLTAIGIYLYYIATSYSKTSSFARLNTLTEFGVTSAENYAITKLINFLQSEELLSPQASIFFRGEDKNWNGQLDEAEDINDNGLLDTNNLDLELSQNPSLSGIIESSDNTTTYFKVKIVDESSKINVNDEATGTYNALTNLSKVLNLDFDLAQIVKDAKEEGSLTLQLLRKVLNKHFDYLKQFITPFGKQQSVIEIDSHKYREGNVKSIKDLQLPQLRLVKKTPVNINTATLPVLKAIFTNVSGYFLDVDHKAEKSIIAVGSSDIQTQFSIGKLKVVTTGDSIFKLVESLLDEVKKKPFVSVVDFRNYLFNANVDGITEEELQLLLANANPNTDSILRTNPDYRQLQVGNKAVWLDTDKTFITRPTIEFSYLPGGIFTIEILVQVRDRKGEVIARNKKTVVYDLMEEVIDTTQEDFLAGQFEKIKNGITRNNRTLITFPEVESKIGGSKHFAGVIGASIDGQLALSPLLITPYLKDESTLFYINFLKGIVADISKGGNSPKSEKSEVNILPDGLLHDSTTYLDYSIKDIIPYEVFDIESLIEEAKKNVPKNIQFYYNILKDHAVLSRKITYTNFGVLIWSKNYYNISTAKPQVLFNMTNPRKKHDGASLVPYFFLLFLNKPDPARHPLCNNPLFLYWGYAFPASESFYCARHNYEQNYRWSFTGMLINTLPMKNFKEHLAQQLKSFEEDLKKAIEITDVEKRREEISRSIINKFVSLKRFKLKEVSKIFINGENSTLPLSIISNFQGNKSSQISEDLDGFVNNVPESFFDEGNYTFSIGGSGDDLFWNFPFYGTISDFVIIKPEEDLEAYIKSIWDAGRYYGKETTFVSRQISIHRSHQAVVEDLKLVKVLVTVYSYNLDNMELILNVSSGEYKVPSGGLITTLSKSDIKLGEWDKRYRIIFKPKGPAYESPYIDEVRLIFLKRPVIIERE